MLKVCTSNGVHPTGQTSPATGKCPFWGANEACSLEGSTCVYQRVPKATPPKPEVAEQVALPEALVTLAKGTDADIDTTCYTSVPMTRELKASQEIMEVCNTADNDTVRAAAAKAYSYSLRDIDFDMMQLSAMFSSISMKASALRGSVERARVKLEAYRAAKSLLVRESFEKGIRTGKQSESVIADIVLCDPEYQAAQDIIMINMQTLIKLDEHLRSIDKHIQVLKKRRDTLENEHRTARLKEANNVSPSNPVRTGFNGKG